MIETNGNIVLNGVPVLSLQHIHRSPRLNSTKDYRDHLLKICIVKQGSGEWVVGGKIYDVREADIFIFNNNEHRNIRSINPPNDMVIMALAFESRFIWSNQYNIFDLGYLKIFFERDQSFENRLDRHHEITIEIRRLMDQIENEFVSRLPGYAQMIKVKLLDILVNLNRQYTYSGGDRDLSFTPKKSLDNMNNVIDYIEGHLDNDLSLETLSTIAHISPCYLSVLFKKLNGINLVEYILKRRIHKAIEQMKSSNKSVIEIAYSTGFNSTSNFYKAFKKVTGTNPADYRKDKNSENI